VDITGKVHAYPIRLDVEVTSRSKLKGLAALTRRIPMDGAGRDAPELYVARLCNQYGRRMDLLAESALSLPIVLVLRQLGYVRSEEIHSLPKPVLLV
jgi:hypothetical protein